MDKVQTPPPSFRTRRCGGEGAILLCACHDPEVGDVWLIIN